ncbi:hypothetical protein [Rhizobium tubonense]|nr:hypothetical protein [Rhizobium tubonense]
MLIGIYVGVYSTGVNAPSSSPFTEIGRIDRLQGGGPVDLAP